MTFYGTAYFLTTSAQIFLVSRNPKSKIQGTSEWQKQNIPTLNGIFLHYYNYSMVKFFWIWNNFCHVSVVFYCNPDVKTSTVVITSQIIISWSKWRKHYHRMQLSIKDFEIWMFSTINMPYTINKYHHCYFQVPSILKEILSSQTSYISVVFNRILCSG